MNCLKGKRSHPGVHHPAGWFAMTYVVLGILFYGITIVCRDSASYQTPHYTKSPCSTWEQGQKRHFLRYHPGCRTNRPLCPVPTHRLPVNAGTASEDTQAKALSPCPRRPIVPNRFSLRSQLCGTLGGCASGFTPASMVSNYDMLFIHHLFRFVKRKFSSGGQVSAAENIHSVGEGQDSPLQ